MTRYHPALVALHWILGVLILIALFGGTFVLDAMPNDHPLKVQGLQGHMTVGIVIAALMVIRLAVRFFTAKPPHADIGNTLLNRLSVWAHWAFYVLVFGMIASGIGMSVLAGLPPIVFGGSGDPLPVTFDDLPPRIAHGFFATALMLLIAGHVAAAFYHQFVRKDGLLRRMWFGKREPISN